MKITIEKLKQTIKPIAIKHNVKMVILFGSVARGESNKLSDIDLAVKDGNIEDFAEDLERQLKTRIDVIDIAKAPIVLKYLIAVEGKLLYGDEWDYHEFKSLALREYFDFKRILEPHTKRARSYIGVESE